MDREGFRNRLKQYKKAREENPGLKYWEWKAQPAEKDIPKYDEGTDYIGKKEIQWFKDWYNKRMEYAIANNRPDIVKQLESLLYNFYPESYKYSLGVDWDNSIYTGTLDPRINGTKISINDQAIKDYEKKHGVKIGGYLHPSEGIVLPSNYNSNDLLHELAHTFNQTESITNAINSAISDENGFVTIPEGLQNPEYWISPWEVHSRLMLFREENNIDPTKVYNEENIKQLRKSAKDKILFEIFDDSQMMHLLNDVADNTTTPTDDRLFLKNGGVVPKYEGGTSSVDEWNPRITAKGYDDEGYYAQAMNPLPEVTVVGSKKGSEVGESGLWDKFTNTVSVLYNNAARKIRNFFEEETPGEVIDLSNLRVTRVTPDTKNLTAIYGNEFVESNANNIRTRKQFEETVDTLIGDKNIPLSRISNFYGVEDGKLKSGDLSIFDENTVVIPNRAKKTGKIKEIIFPDNTGSAKLKELAESERQNNIKRFAEMADSLGLEYGNNWFTLTIYGSPYTVIRDEYSRRKKSDITDAFTKEYERINRSSNEIGDLVNRTNMKFVTESNDTVFAKLINIPQKFKQFYADEKGNALFVNNSGNLTKQQQEQINSALKSNPMYPILIDNGRYMHYQTNNPNYHTYTAYDFTRDPKNMYVIGTTK